MGRATSSLKQMSLCFTEVTKMTTFFLQGIQDIGCNIYTSQCSVSKAEVSTSCQFPNYYTVLATKEHVYA